MQAQGEAIIGRLAFKFAANGVEESVECFVTFQTGAIVFALKGVEVTLQQATLTVGLNIILKAP